MSDQTPAASGAPAKPPAPAGPKPPAPVPARNFKVASKHDWCVVKAANEGEARQKWHEFFGIRGSDHEVEVTATSDKAGTHSGQKTADTKTLAEVTV